jgi:hypothetical protein
MPAAQSAALATSFHFKTKLERIFLAGPPSAFAWYRDPGEITQALLNHTDRADITNLRPRLHHHRLTIGPPTTGRKRTKHITV